MFKRFFVVFLVSALIIQIAISSGIPILVSNDFSSVRRILQPIRISLVDFLELKTLSGAKATMLAVCPFSRTTIRAALESARDNDCPVLFATSRDQVDIGGGYTGWDAQELFQVVHEIAAEVGFTGIFFMGREHAGPWTNYFDIKNGLSEVEAMERLKASLREDIQAGFECIQIDATIDPTIDGDIAMETVIARTIELIRFITQESDGRHITLSVGGGKNNIAEDIANPDTIVTFISRLKEELKREGLDIWPEFFVPHSEAQASSHIDIPPPVFNPDAVRAASVITASEDMFIKWHHGDNMDAANLALFPEIGVDIANKGPEFGVLEMEIYLDFEMQELETLSQVGQIDRASGFSETMKTAIINDGLYTKFVDKEAEDITNDEWRKILLSCGRYVYSYPEIQDAFNVLFSNLNDLGIEENPERVVIDAIKEEIESCIELFNLRGLTSTIVASSTERNIDYKNIKAVAFDIGGTLTDSKIPSDGLISEMARLMNSGVNVALITGKRESSFKDWVEDKLLPQVVEENRTNLRIYGDRMTRVYVVNADGNLAEDESLRIDFPYSEHKEQISIEVQNAVDLFMVEVVEGQRYGDDIVQFFREHPIKVTVADTYIQAISDSGIPFDSIRSDLRVRIEEHLLASDFAFVLDRVSVDLLGKNGAYILSNKAKKPGAIEHICNTLDVNLDNMVYVADQFSGETIPDAEVSDIGVWCINVGADNSEVSNVINFNSGPQGVSDFITEFIEKRN